MVRENQSAGRGLQDILWGLGEGGDERNMDVQRPENDREIIDAIIHFGIFSNES